MPTTFWKMESKNVSGNGVAGRQSWDLTLFSLSCSLIKALMSFENRQKANNKKNKNLDKGIQFTCELLNRLPAWDSRTER